jgi:hypothetical protein
MTSCGPSLGVLSQCIAPAPNLARGDRLRAALADVRDWDALVADAEDHGVETLLLTHTRAHGVRLPSAVETRLKVRFMQQAHAAAVRARVVATVLDAFDADDISVLVLKGAALAHLVYPDPVLRPMHDVDVLVAERDANPAWQSLRRAGFTPIGGHPGPRHHHLHSLAITADGETIAVEIHRQLLAAAPFVRPLRYEDVTPRAQAFTCGTRPARTLGHEDMLWHIYAHAFLVPVIRPETRLIWIADLVGAMEAWADLVDWDRLRRVYPRLVRALPLIGALVPWSPRVQRRLDCPRRHTSTKSGTAAWWFDVQYGNDCTPRRIWNRLIAHPVNVALTAAQMARLKLDLTLYR